MYHPTTRVLTVLELLQSHRVITGAEIARRLEIDIRTARRYVVMLEELGIPVIAERGRYGGYRLMPGFKLPPLMLSGDEALAITLGLRSAQRFGLAAHAPAVEGALAKIERVLPQTVRDRVRVVEETMVWDVGTRSEGGIDITMILPLSTAVREQRQVFLHYRRTKGETTQRAFDPYGLTCQGGRWYTIGHCHLRNEQRLFRLDRIIGIEVGEEMFERPIGFDVLAAVVASLGSIPRAFALEVVLETTLEAARWHIPVRVATLEERVEGGLLLRGYTDSLDRFARLLASMGCPLEVRHPVELRTALRRHAEQIHQWATQGESD